MQLLPLKAPVGAGTWKEVVNRTGVGPATIDTGLGSGAHTFSVEFACDGVGTSRLITADGRTEMSVISTNMSRCINGFTYGTRFKVRRAGQHLRLIARPSMHWALQIWAK